MKFILFLTFLVLSSASNLRFTADVTSQGQQIKGLSQAANYVNSITSTYQSLVRAVKTYKSDTIRAMWKNAGFSEIDLRGTIKVSEGIQEIYYDRYRANIVKTFKIPDHLQPYFEEYLYDDDMADHASWSKTELDYDADNLAAEKKLRHLTFLSNHRDDGKADATAISIEFKFDLAPQVEVINHSLSVAGGIYSHSKDEIVTKPREMTNEDIQAMITIAQLFSFRFVAFQLGIVLELPSFN